MLRRRDRPVCFVDAFPRLGSLDDGGIQPLQQVIEGLSRTPDEHREAARAVVGGRHTPDCADWSNADRPVVVDELGDSQKVDRGPYVRLRQISRMLCRRLQCSLCEAAQASHLAPGILERAV